MATKPAFAQGAQVEHPKFGLGSVLSCSDEYIVIKFDDHGERSSLASTMKKYCRILKRATGRRR